MGKAGTSGCAFTPCEVCASVKNLHGNPRRHVMTQLREMFKDDGAYEGMSLLCAKIG